MLFAGLRPYASYSDNWVEFDAASGVTRFKGFGLAHGDLTEDISNASMSQDLSIKFTVNLRYPDHSSFRILAQLDSPGSTDPMIIGQWKNSIIVINSRDYRNQFGLPRVSANLEEHMGASADLLITFSSEESRIDVNGRFAASGEPFAFTEPLTRISIGNSPDGKHGWVGGLASFSIARMSDDTSVSSFDLSTNALPNIENLTQSEHSLVVPGIGKFPDKAWIGTMELDQLLDQNLRDVVINFAGFAPFGFALAGVFRRFRKPANRSMLKTVFDALLVGFIFSLLIEVTQTQIPGRNSHAHDLLLNTVGTLPGSIGYFVLAGLFAWVVSRNKAETS